MHRVFGYAATEFAARRSRQAGARHSGSLNGRSALAQRVLASETAHMTDRETKSRAVKILAKSIYRDLEAQGFDEKQIVALATELISEVTTKMARVGDKQQLA
jgi:hypothetical protein